jgi:Na+/proline symporter
MVVFGFLDWFWLIAFILLMVGSGVLFYRLGKRSESDFFLAGRGLPWWLPASSVYATHTATDTPMWVTGVIYKYGFAGLWYTFFSAWCAISAFVTTRIFRRSLAYTQAEWQSLRFGGMAGELLRGWIAGWQVFLNMFILGWVGIAMGKVCQFLFGWPLWIGLILFSSICAIYVLAAGYWGVVMADFQQGVIAFIVIVIVSIWGIYAAGGPSRIIDNLKKYNSTYEWKLPEKIPDQSEMMIRITDSETGKPFAQTNGPIKITKNMDEKSLKETEEKIFRLVKEISENKNNSETVNILFPTLQDTLMVDRHSLIVWTSGKTGKNVNIDYSLDDGETWVNIASNHFDGQTWRLNPFSFTGFFKGDFPVIWFATMLFIAVLGGLGMGTSIDWYAEAQRIQSARTIKDASWSIWSGTAMVLVRNALWAAAILGFFVLYPHLVNVKNYEMGWFRLGFENLPAGMIGFFFAAIVAIHISTISTHLNLGAAYITRDLYHHYINPKAKQERLIWVGRFATVLLLLGSFVFGSIMENITEWLIFALWIMAAGVWLPNILQVIWWRFNGWGYLTAWISNLVLSWLVVWVLPAFGVLPELKDYQQFWLLLALGALIFIPVTFLTKHENMDRLVKFYVMSRPVGWWGPVKKEAQKRGLL